MRSSRLSPVLVAVIGVVLSLVAAGCITYFLIMPARQEAQSFEARYHAAYPDSTPSVQKKAQQDLTLAGVEVAQTKAQWAVIENTLMPPYDVSQRYTAWRQLSSELALNLGPDLARYFRSTGVIPLTSVTLPAPPPSPNLITAAPLVVPISGSSSGSAAGAGSYAGGGGASGAAGSISVGGSFRQILHHVQLWNSFNRLVLIDNLALHGNSPYMSGSYGATVIIFPQNDDKLDKTILAAPNGAVTGPGGGYPGGMGG